ncbi:MAG TPA: nitrile hydratase subunit beta, partial [Acidimicrobiia bacterium]|nr:nitrile hydratase subunit beta [Acidimicrobiia bacterium]
MNGVHDVGGLHGFGPVQPEPDEPVFHDAWERRLLALHVSLGLGGSWTLDEFRHARETLPPAQFLAAGYYETVLSAVERLATTHGLVGPDELAGGRSLRTDGPPPRPLTADRAGDALRRGNPSAREAPRPARFTVGASVRAKNIHPVTHTRLPRYVRGHVGIVESVHGCHVLPDTRAHGGGDDPQWLYTVRFTASELWGPDADPTLSVS